MEVTKTLELNKAQLDKILVQIGLPEFTVRLKSLLTKQHCKIRFEKVNGDMREMMVTTAPEAITEAGKADGAPKYRKDSVIPVWDVTAQMWKSFRIESLQYLSYEEPMLLTEDKKKTESTEALTNPCLEIELPVTPIECVLRQRKLDDDILRAKTKALTRKIGNDSLKVLEVYRYGVINF